MGISTRYVDIPAEMHPIFLYTIILCMYMYIDPRSRRERIVQVENRRVELVEQYRKNEREKSFIIYTKFIKNGMNKPFKKLTNRTKE